jgi:hypothetical protein
MRRSAASSRARRSMKPRGLRASGREASVMAPRLASGGVGLKEGFEGASIASGPGGGHDGRGLSGSPAPSASAGLGGKRSGQAAPLRSREGRMVGAVVMRITAHGARPIAEDASDVTFPAVIPAIGVQASRSFAARKPG